MYTDSRSLQSSQEAYPVYDSRERKRSLSASSESSYGSEFEEQLPEPKRKDDYLHSGAYGYDHGSVVETKATTVDDRIEASNVGAKLLARMGWNAGKGLGKNNQGRVDPIRIVDQHGSLGLGIAHRDSEALDSTILKGREILSVKMVKESADDRLKREDNVAKQQAVKDEIKQSLAVFNCELCNKQYKNSGEWNEHLNSYDHHHRKRAAEYKASQKLASLASGDLDRRREKERRREAKDLQKQFGLSAGVPIFPTANQVQAQASLSKVPIDADTPIPGVTEVKKPKLGFKKIGSSALSQNTPIASTSQTVPDATPSLPSSGDLDGVPMQEEGMPRLPPAQTTPSMSKFKPAFKSTLPNRTPSAQTMTAFQTEEDEDADDGNLTGKPVASQQKHGFKPIPKGGFNFSRPKS